MNPYFAAPDGQTILLGDVRDVLRELPSESVQCCVTSPPYWNLRDYGVEGQIGLEPTPEAYCATMVEVFREVRRVLRSDGVMFLNLGDSYAGSGRGPQGETGMGNHSVRQGWDDDPRGPRRNKTDAPAGLKAKDLCGIPWMVAFALRTDGWWLRSAITWAKRACMPESVTDRPTSATEMIFLLTKAATYYYDADAVREPAAESTQDRAGLGKCDIGPRHHALIESGHHGATDSLRDYGRSGANLRNFWLLGPEPFSDWTGNVRRVPVVLGEVDGDTKRTTSPDCPVHGDQSGRATTADDGGREGVESSRNGRSDGRHGQGRSSDAALSQMSLLADYAPDSLDSQSLQRDPAASDRNTQNHRTDRAPGTNPAYTPSERTSAHTGRTEALRAALAPDGCDNPSASETLAGTSRTGTCTCSYYKEVTESISHFATFPTEIPRRAILAGTSEAGCCPKCGRAWERVTEPTPEYAKLLGRDWSDAEQDALEGRGHSVSGQRQTKRGATATASHITLGFRAACSCDAGDPVPCTILDPFLGSGTSLMVARRLGRRGVGIELNPKYAELAVKRLEGQTLSMFALEAPQC